MHARVRVASALVFALGLTTAARALAHDDDFATVVARIKPSIVGIGTFVATRRPPALLLGTGFAIGSGNEVATNQHVIAGKLDAATKERLVVFVGQGRKPDLRDATVIASDDTHDLAILRVAGAALPALALAPDNSAREGDAIGFTGFPIGAVLGLYPVTHRGIVSAITPIVIPAIRTRELTAAQVLSLRDPYTVLQLDATAYPGNSGSPVYLRSSGAVVGIINQVLVKGKKEHVLSDPSAITYAIPITYLRGLMAR